MISISNLKKIVRFDTYPWNLTQEDFNYYTPNNDGIIGDFQFLVNYKIRECDFWVIRGSIQSNFSLVKCPRKNVIFILDEAYEAAEFPVKFLNQFAKVIGPKEVNHPKYIRHHEMFPWLFNRVSYSDLIKKTSHNKEREICIIVSDVTWLKGHKDRFAFANRIIGHFKDRIDVYGRGFNAFECKYQILKRYKYSICIENSSLPDYFTEKINECYLSDVMPIYYGCSNIFEYYEPNSMVLIDINNFELSIQKIEDAINSKLWEKNIELIHQMKLRYFAKYHLPNVLASKFLTESVMNKKWILVFHKKFFEDLGFDFRMLKNALFRVISKLTVISLKKTFGKI